MRRLFAWSLGFVLLAALTVLPWLMLDNAPAIEPPAEFQRADLAGIKSLFQKHDPRRQTPDMLHSIRLDEAELNRVLNYAVKLPRVSGIAAELTPGLATITATLTVPALCPSGCNPFGRYLNITADVAEAPGGIQIQSLQLGSLPLPGALADWVARQLHRQLLRDPTYAAMVDAFSRVDFAENQATLDYRWHPELLTRIERKGVDLLIAPEDQARMLVYAEQLNGLLKPYPPGDKIPLVQVVSPLLQFAVQSGGDPKVENRAALTALAAYLGGVSLPRLLAGDSRSIYRAPPVLLTLHGRRDLAEHFTLSAALSINGGSQLANAIGLMKEEEDANKGSGFSFTDLAADLAGVRLGERATSDTATRVRQQLAAARTDADLLPDMRDLPEFMPQAEFDRRFGPVGSARYLAVITRIDDRLDAHPLLQ
ncbi:MAG TPA: hypothetical protein PLE48_13675 [Thiobacillus sp.]|nr:MAG: hypothetical protein B7Y50_02405 [Hydrogenophilales bacterium 28-61-11]OYZ58088.1 MAG: hypothetical protein B7Y21_04920 [Hydrogenophilales bacterium 16-61-112]OZA47758.1 MAG: hypothetical protein B7X81_04825 [Hydrogenophilales bacterium 17-61-76]HQT31606.1 hypothetical protein [Thiobacillus sp.]HQT71456.1 hypothetical protein [Thiobacillus sp.]